MITHSVCASLGLRYARQTSSTCRDSAARSAERDRGLAEVDDRSGCSATPPKLEVLVPDIVKKRLQVQTPGRIHRQVAALRRRYAPRR